jgi:hypothetical protein
MDITFLERSCRLSQALNVVQEELLLRGVQTVAAEAEAEKKPGMAFCLPRFQYLVYFTNLMKEFALTVIFTLFAVLQSVVQSGL